VTPRVASLLTQRSAFAMTPAPWFASIVLTALLLGMFATSHRAAAQSAPQPKLHQRLSGSVKLGPRLLDYRIECVDSRACRVQCFQHGTKVIDREIINKTDQLRMLASTSVDDDIVPRWIEIRSADGKEAQTLLLSRDTTCDLKSLIIAPDTRP